MQYVENSSEIPRILSGNGKRLGRRSQNGRTIRYSNGIRRFGVVLSKNAGALPLMVLPYQMFVGGRIGHGKQWVSWIHIEDVVRAIHFAIMNSDIQGQGECWTAPAPSQLETFGKTIAAVIQTPSLVPVPYLSVAIITW